MLIAQAQSMLPWWLVVPVTALVMIVIAGHLIVLQRADLPASRRRIRTATNLLALLGVPLFALGISISHQHAPDVFVLVWVAVMAIFGLVVVLALVDIANNMRLTSLDRSQQVRAAAEAMAADIAARQGTAGGGTSSNEGSAAGRPEPPRG